MNSETSRTNDPGTIQKLFLQIFTLDLLLTNIKHKLRLLISVTLTINFCFKILKKVTQFCILVCCLVVYQLLVYYNRNAGLSI